MALCAAVLPQQRSLHRGRDARFRANIGGSQHSRRNRPRQEHHPCRRRPSSRPHPHPQPRSPGALAVVTLAALGVVYGDIGTSPLYALRECFHGPHAIAVTRGNVLGVLSLIFWSLVLVISIKYLIFVMRADNQGEGGILALMALVPADYRSAQSRGVLVALGLFGAALLYGDGMITPAISVLGAVEGLTTATPALRALRRPAHGRSCSSRSSCCSRTGPPESAPSSGRSWSSGSSPSARSAPAPSRATRTCSSAADPRHALGLLRAQRVPRVPRARLRVPRRHRRRSALCGHGALRQAADPPGVVLARAAGAAAELLRTGRAAAQRPARRRSSRSTCSRPRWLLYPLVGAGHAGGGHRVAGAHLGGVLADAAGRAARIQPAHGHPLHVRRDDGPDLHPAGELGADARHDRASSSRSAPRARSRPPTASRSR